MASLIERLLCDDSAGEGQDPEDRAHDRLQARVGDRRGVDDAAVTGVAVGNGGAGRRAGRGSDRAVLAPDEDVTPEAVRETVDPFDGVFVRRFGATDCRRMAIPPDLAGRLVAEPGWGVEDLRAAVLDGHDVDDAIAPVAWRQSGTTAGDPTQPSSPALRLPPRALAAAADRRSSDGPPLGPRRCGVAECTGASSGSRPRPALAPAGGAVRRRARAPARSRSGRARVRRRAPPSRPAPGWW